MRLGKFGREVKASKDLGGGTQVANNSRFSCKNMYFKISRVTTEK